MAKSSPQVKAAIPNKNTAIIQSNNNPLATARHKNQNALTEFAHFSAVKNPGRALTTPPPAGLRPRSRKSSCRRPAQE